ncbi:MAG: hypothetical protein QG670_1605 [Thermoproteota archaeon]|nr:hypothetical protein [Thermoproteota archaeon]
MAESLTIIDIFIIQYFCSKSMQGFNLILKKSLLIGAILLFLSLSLVTQAVSAISSTPQLSINSLTVDKPVSYVGNSLTATCVVNNTGGEDATDVIVSIVAQGLQVLQSTKTIGTLPTGGSQTVNFDLKAISIGIHDLNVTVTSSNANSTSKTRSINVGSDDLPYILSAALILSAIMGFYLYWKFIKKPKN